ncbi:MAG: hypothetical protein IT260_15435, partial [Saprospiraceae bacterium]|nr:hypothetical protein [Saprospiraceae bacterium]
MRLFTCLVFWFSILPMLLAQTPPPCAPGAGPSDFCNTVCLSCDFQNGTIINSAPYTPDISADDCLGIHNNYWYAFTAAEAEATFSAFPTNCLTGQGIQIAIYDQCEGNCLSFDYGCDGSPVSTTISNMEIGQVYYMTIDGCSGDICDIQMFIEPLSAIQAPQLGPTPPMVGPAEACPGGTITYCLTQPLEDASQYVWTIPADATLNGQQGPGPITLYGPGGACADIKFGPSLGPKQVCVRPRNACHPGQIVCKTIQLKKIPDTQVPPAVICQDEVADFLLPWGDPINASLGTVNYQTTLPSYIGCDSIVKMAVTVLPAKFKQLPTQYACPGDCVTVGGETICAAGNHTVETETVQGCDSIISFQLVLVEVDPEITVNGTFNCGTSSLTLSSVPQSSTQKLWKNAQGQSIGTLDNVQITQPGQYTLTVTKTIGGVTCFRTDTVLIVGSQDIPTLSATAAGAITCTGAPVQLSTQTNASSPIFSWTGPNGFFSTANSPAVSLGGTYNVTVSAPNGCTATASVSVPTNTAIPGIQLSADSISCTKDSAQLSAQTTAALPGFAWSGPNGFSSTIAQPVAFSGGNYTLIVIDSLNGCRDTAVVEVGLDVGVPVLSATGSGPIGCLNPAITLQATTQNGAASFAWTGPAGFVSGDPSPIATLAGEYIVTASTPNGCTATASVVVTGDTQLPDLFTLSDTLTCTAPEANISGTSNTPGVLFAWTGPGNFVSDQSLLNVSIPGDYVLTLTAPNGCVATATVPVLSDQLPPDVSVTGAILDCLHPDAVVAGTSAAANAVFSWTGPNGFSAQAPSNTVTVPGDYVLTVQTPNGCTATAVASVGQDTLAPDIQALSDGDITCLHPVATLSATSAVPAASFFWMGPGGTANTAELTTNTGGSYLLTVTHPQNGCTAQAAVSVVVDTLKPLVVVVSGILTCTKDTVPLVSDALGSNLSWAWTGPGNFISTDPNPKVNLPGDYLLTLTNQDNGCVTLLTEPVQADQEPPLVSALAGLLSCAQPALSLVGTSTPPGTFSWSGPSGFVSNEPEPMVQTPGNYQLTATAANGCTATTTVLVDSDFNPPGATALGDTIDCFSGSAVLTGGSPDVVSWSWSGPGNFSSDQQNPQVTSAGDYTLVVTGQNGCSATATASVSLNQDAPDVDITGVDLLTCLVTGVQLSASIADPIVSGQWSTGAQASSITVSAPGTYSYTAQGLSGCLTTETVVVQQDTAAPQNVLAAGGQLTCSQTSLSLNGSATGAVLSWQWSGPANFSSTAQNPGNVATPGQYVLVVTNTSNGCTASAITLVTEDPSIPEVSATADTLNCQETVVEIDLVANRPDLTYAWTGPNGFVASQANPLVSAPGLYTLLATAPNGCTATITLAVAQDIAPP